MRNSKTIYQFGFQVSDTLQEWVEEGLVAGPLLPDEVEAALGADYTVNPMGAKQKDNGKIRITVDASSPHDVDESVPSWIWSPQLPGSVNSTIDIEQFPARMSSVTKFVKTLWRAGRGALVCKIDWCSAFKHQHVAKDDLKLQVLEWGGRMFVELRLMFGGRSSVGIYNDLAVCFLNSVCKISGMSRGDVEQHLDDVLGVGPPGENSQVHVFFKTYLEEAARVGVRIDSSGNVDKVQAPATRVTALGVEFDTVAWTWRFKAAKLARIMRHLQSIVMGEDQEFRAMQSITGKLFDTVAWTWRFKAAKLARIMRHLQSIVMGEDQEFRAMQSITGKLVDVRGLVRGGKYNLLLFLQASNLDLKPYEVVVPSSGLQEQARWWMVALLEADRHSSILHPEPPIPSNALEAWTDAAGGSSIHMGAGLGGVVPPFRYFYLPWPAWLNHKGSNSDGVVFSSKLTCLELLGPLVVLATCGDMAAGGHLRVYVDNQGSVDVFKKGHSTKCVYSSSIAKAIFEVAEAIGAVVSVEKIRRCSDRGSYLADKISKGRMDEVKTLLPMRNLPCTIPKSILEWVKDPRLDLRWSKIILQEMEASGVEVIRKFDH